MGALSLRMGRGTTQRNGPEEDFQGRYINKKKRKVYYLRGPKKRGRGLKRLSAYRNA